MTTPMPANAGPLVCPRCKVALEADPVRGVLICRAEALAYPVRDGIAIMLLDEVRAVEPDEES